MNLLSGQGRWAVEAAIEEAVAADVITAALFTHFRSPQDHTFDEKMLSAIRFGLGGQVKGQEPIDPGPKPKDARAATRLLHFDCGGSSIQYRSLFPSPQTRSVPPRKSA